ncbi:MAG: hypothetical protein KAU03_01260 [Candidatus Altiarchaeales archaeon]|nr:hypothetical protein [Candidatus Altiarchaeales archaeon]
MGKEGGWIKWLIATAIVGGVLLGLASSGYIEANDKAIFLLLAVSIFMMIKLYPTWKRAQRTKKLKEKQKRG